jgi:hypothetical protein
MPKPVLTPAARPWYILPWRNAMTRLRLLVVAILVLAVSSCQLIKNENFISFTLDGVQYFFTASAVEADHPYAIGYYLNSGDPAERYVIRGSATAAGASAMPNPKDTLEIGIGYEADWYMWASFYDSDGFRTDFNLPSVPYGMIDAFITNRNEVGEQFSGSLPGPFYGTETPALENIIFSVERLPDELYEFIVN